MEMSDTEEASEAGVPVCVSGGTSSAACVAKTLGGASGALKVPGAPSYGRWDLRDLPRRGLRRVVASLEVPVHCPVCQERGEDKIFLGGKQLDMHIQKDHPGTPIEWKCEFCPKIFGKFHAWRCHYAKCKREEVNPPAAFMCEICTAGFGTQSGLSQHERHAHPNTRNEKRAAEHKSTPAKGGKKLTVWTPTELELLEKLNSEYHDEKNINIKLMEFFPGKSNKQIGEARRRFKGKSNAQAIGEMETVITPEEGQAADEEGTPMEDDTPCETEAQVDSNGGPCNWIEDLRKEMLTTYNAETWKDLANKFIELASGEVTAASVDELYNEFERSLGSREEKEIKQRTHKVHQNKKRRKRTSRLTEYKEKSTHTQSARS